MRTPYSTIALLLAGVATVWMLLFVYLAKQPILSSNYANLLTRTGIYGAYLIMGTGILITIYVSHNQMRNIIIFAFVSLILTLLYIISKHKKSH